MHRRIEYAQRAAIDSLGRNGRMATLGCDVVLFEEGQPTAVVMPVSSRGDAGRAEIAIDAEAAGEVGAFLVEVFCRHATPAARRALLERLALICHGEPDPVRTAEEAEKQARLEAEEPRPPGMR